MTRDQLRYVIGPQAALVATLLGEAGGEPIEGQIAVACVIRNRARRPRWWGSDIKSVCLQRLQFSCWWEAGPNTDRVYALAEALYRRSETAGPLSLTRQLQWIAAGVSDDALLDITGGADHYLTTRLLTTAPPGWAKGRTPTRAIGAHAFFRLEA